MSSAHYMVFEPGIAQGASDRIGGAPTHLPRRVPDCPTANAPMAFLAQFYCAPGRLEVPGLLAIQLYQCRGVDEGHDPLPRAVGVPLDARENLTGEFAAESSVIPHSVRWEVREDPEPLPRDQEYDDVRVFDSKIGGTCPFDLDLPPRSRYLLQLDEEPGNMNFAGRAATIFLDESGELQVQLT